MTRKKDKNLETEERTKVCDDNGIVIDDIQDFLNQPDEELKQNVLYEKRLIELNEAKQSFMYKLHKIDKYTGIGRYLTYDNMDEFLTWCQRNN